MKKRTSATSAGCAPPPPAELACLLKHLSPVGISSGRLPSVTRGSCSRPRPLPAKRPHPRIIIQTAPPHTTRLHRQTCPCLLAFSRHWSVCPSPHLTFIILLSTPTYHRQTLGGQRRSQLRIPHELSGWVCGGSCHPNTKLVRATIETVLDPCVMRLQTPEQVKTHGERQLEIPSG